MIDEIVAWLSARLLAWIPLLLSLSVHEYAHALAASWLGDRTAESQGRLTLDPAAHADPVGTVLLPLLGVPFGWAKPVPVNPANFRGGGDGRLGMLVTAAAGPASNMAIAVACAGILAMMQLLSPDLAHGLAGRTVASTIGMNTTLAVFNLLPFPPLDGSRVVDFLCPESLRPAWAWLYARSGLGIAFLLLAMVFSGVDLVGWAASLGAGLVGLALGGDR